MNRLTRAMLRAGFAAVVLVASGCGGTGRTSGDPVSSSAGDAAGEAATSPTAALASVAVLMPDAASTPSPAAAPSAPAVSAPSPSAVPAKPSADRSGDSATVRPSSPPSERTGAPSGGSAAGSAASLSAGSSSGASGASPAQPAAERAELLYRQNCAVCHGGERQGGFGPNLQRVGGRLSRDAIVRQITQGGDGMPAFGGRLSEADIRALADWLSART